MVLSGLVSAPRGPSPVIMGPVIARPNSVHPGLQASPRQLAADSEADEIRILDFLVKFAKYVLLCYVSVEHRPALRTAFEIRAKGKENLILLIHFPNYLCFYREKYTLRLQSITNNHR